MCWSLMVISVTEFREMALRKAERLTSLLFFKKS